MKRKLISATLFFLFAGCISIAPASLAQPAMVNGNVEEVITYYSSSSLTTVVGVKTVYCSGEVVINGTVTDHETARLFPCLID
jgi:Family of unknown function (DUF6289)